jgi:hypothetical protein
MSKRVRQEPGSGAPSDMQTENRRADGKFAKGNKAGKTFRRGQSGNPAGRPKFALLSDSFRHMLGEVCPDDEHGRTWAEVIAERLFVAAAGGDVRAAKEIADRTEGKARSFVTLSYETRDLYERAVKEIVESSGCSREEAIRTLAIFQPDAISLLVN